MSWAQGASPLPTNPVGNPPGPLCTPSPHPSSSTGHEVRVPLPLLSRLALSLAAVSDPDSLHIYVLDFDSQGLGPLAALPHTGAVIAAAERERQTRLLRFLSSEVERRRVAAASGLAESGIGGSRIVLLIDGFQGFCNAFDAPADLVWKEALTRLIADGPGFDVTVIATADRPGAVPGPVAARLRIGWCSVWRIHTTMPPSGCARRRAGSPWQGHRHPDRARTSGGLLRRHARGGGRRHRRIDADSFASAGFDRRAPLARFGRRLGPGELRRTRVAGAGGNRRRHPGSGKPQPCGG